MRVLAERRCAVFSGTDSLSKVHVNADLQV